MCGLFVMYCVMLYYDCLWCVLLFVCWYVICVTMCVYCVCDVSCDVASFVALLSFCVHVPVDEICLCIVCDYCVALHCVCILFVLVCVSEWCGCVCVFVYD